MLATSPNMLLEMEYASRLIRGVNQNPGCIDSKTLLMAATIYGAKV